MFCSVFVFKFYDVIVFQLDLAKRFNLSFLDLL